jgi:hypothetical protein
VRHPIYSNKRYCSDGINADLTYELNSNANAKFDVADKGNATKEVPG